MAKNKKQSLSSKSNYNSDEATKSTLLLKLFQQVKERFARRMHPVIDWFISSPTWLIVSLAVAFLAALDLWISSDRVHSIRDAISVLLDRAEAMGILAAVVVFIKEAPLRIATKHYEAWRAIDAAHGIKTSYARYHAFEDLCKAGVSLKGLDVSGADFNSINLHKVDLSSANLREAQFQGAILSQANLSKADLSGADLLNVDFRGADLRGADLRGANLNGANMNGANLSGANLGNANLKIADLRFANLRGANLKGASLRGANLQGASLYLADMTQANLSKTDMTQTDLSQATFRGSNLSMAHLNQACFHRAILVEADLWGAVLEEADLDGANFKSAQGLTLAQVKTAINWEQAVYEDGFLTESNAPSTSEPSLTDLLYKKLTNDNFNFDS
ncbi:pentapeptide repeat-containing protein [Oscillatoria sp. FACHB-1407]|uniref:pentapeptide repeat-containing protein n=1 Tax=Oscillatoria sp. FACHB-1407 TaxID=2692847 RepID=UPI001688EC97|nr:pentapeptide repeat-containing protein [Oscillatoria sp. FACHB-1407]MBD2463373.1 pentapeptide repeat-containing protein [Oscillatoria sp. FACHB-1407]